MGVCVWVCMSGLESSAKTGARNAPSVQQWALELIGQLCCFDVVQ